MNYLNAAYIYYFCPGNSAKGLKFFAFMEVKRFKADYENRLFVLYQELDRYFNEKFRNTSTGYYNSTGNILPFLHQCSNVFWCKGEKDYSKIIKVDIPDHDLDVPHYSFESLGLKPLKKFNPNRSFEERCEIVKNNPITEEMSYEERLDAQKARFGL